MSIRTDPLDLPQRVPCVGAIVRDAAGRLLVVRRGREPALGRWSVPGGRVEPGEDDAAAVVRELREETGLTVRVGDLVGEVERAGLAGATYVIRDYECQPAGGMLVAGDDAAEARWVTPAELLALPTSEGLVDSLREWGVLPG
jgi:ADP-ribose pyrophosphatase YjhB (NUDIX family)